MSVLRRCWAEVQTPEGTAVWTLATLAVIVLDLLLPSLRGWTLANVLIALALLVVTLVLVHLVVGQRPGRRNGF